MPQCRWQEPELSVGPPCASLDLLGRYKCWSIKDKSPAYLVWKSVAKPITTLLEDQYEHLDAGGSELMVEMFMVGRKTGGSVPTILFSCESKTCRQKAMRLVQRKSILAAHPGVLMAECSRLPKPLALGEESNHQSLPPGVYLDGPLRACGTSVLISSRLNELPKKATIGGIVYIDDEFYGVTTAHAFLAPKEDHGGSKGDLEFSFFGDDNPFDSSDEEDESVEMTSQASISSGSSQSPSTDETERYRHMSLASSLSSGITEKDGYRFSRGEKEETEPRRKSSESTLVKLGSLFISTGSESGLDWALVKIEHSTMLEFLSSENNREHEAKLNPPPLFQFSDSLVLKGQSQSAVDSSLSTSKPAGLMRRLSDKATQFVGRSHASEESTTSIRRNLDGLFRYPASVASGPSDADVVLCTGSGGAVQGKLSAVPSFTKAVGQARFQQLLTVNRNEGIFSDGDCGSWAIDVKTEAVYGHIVSGYPGTGTAYLVPASQIFVDIQLCLGKSIKLLSKTRAAGIDLLVLKNLVPDLKDTVVAQPTYLVDFDEENAYTHYFDRERSTVPEVSRKQNITQGTIVDMSKIETIDSKPPKKESAHIPAYDNDADADGVKKEVKKVIPRPAYVIDVDEDGNTMKETRRSATTTTKPSASNTQAKKHTKSSSDSGYYSGKFTQGLSASHPTIPEDHAGIKEEPKLERRKSKDAEPKKLRKSSTPQKHKRSSSGSKDPPKSQGPGRPGMPTAMRTGSLPVVSHPIPLHPHVMQARPVSYYAPNSGSLYGSGTRPPISPSAFYPTPQSTQPAYMPQYPPSHPPPYPQIMQNPYQFPPSFPAGSHMLHYYTPPPSGPPGIPPPRHDYFASPQQQRPLASRFDPIRRSSSAAVEPAYDDGGYASASETIRRRKSIGILPRPNSGGEKAREYEDVLNPVGLGDSGDRATMPPPARPRASRPNAQYSIEGPRRPLGRPSVSYDLTRDMEKARIEPNNSVVRRRDLRQSYYGNPASLDSKSHEEKLRAAARYQEEVNGPIMPGMPPPRLPSSRRPVSYEVDKAAEAVQVASNKAKATYGMEKSNDEYFSPTAPLTADTLKKMSQVRRRRSRSRSGSGTSILSSSSRDESDYRVSASTRTTRSGGDNDENMTIKVTGQARVMVGGAAIDCNDGGEIQIMGSRTRRDSDSGYDEREIDTRRTREDSGYGGSISSETQRMRRRFERPSGRSRISERSNVSGGSDDTVGKGKGKGTGGTAPGPIQNLDNYYI